MAYNDQDEKLFGAMIFVMREPLEVIQELLCLSPVCATTQLLWAPKYGENLELDHGHIFADIADGQAWRELHNKLPEGTSALLYIFYSDETLVDNGGVFTFASMCGLHVSMHVIISACVL